MESLSLTTATTSNTSNFRFFIPSFKCPKTCRIFPFHRKQHRKFLVLAAKDESNKLDSWDQMELKFGKLIGEDPQLTLAKIMVRKTNPELSYLEIEKLYKKDKKALTSIIEEVPFDLSDVRRKSENSLDGLNLVRPVPMEGVEFETDDKPLAPEENRTSQPVGKTSGTPTGSVPNVILRKPTTHRKDHAGMEASPSMSLKPNLSLNMSKEQSSGRFSSMILVRKPERSLKNEDVILGETKTEATVNTKESRSREYTDVLLRKPEITVVQADRDHKGSSSDVDHSTSREYTDVSLLPKPEITVVQADRDHKGSSSDNDDSTSGECTDVSLLPKPEITVVQADRDHKGSSSDVDHSTSGECTDVSLLPKPEIPVVQADRDHKGSSSDNDDSTSGECTDVPLLQKPEISVVQADRDHKGSSSNIDDTDYQSRSDGLTEMENMTKVNTGTSLDSGGTSKLQALEHNSDLSTGSQPPEQRGTEKTSASDITDNSNTKISLDAALLGRPKRLDEPAKEKTKTGGGVTDFVSPIFNDNFVESKDLPTTPLLKGREDTDWKKAEYMMVTAERVEVELISSSTRGFVVSFGSLIGFLPYRNLTSKWKYIAFESWLWKKGVDPSLYKQDLGIIGSSDDPNWTISANSGLDPKEVEGEISPDMKFEDLLTVYDQAKLKHLSSFVGQQTKVNVILVDRESRKLVFSLKPKEKEEAIERKRRLMAKLNVGDVVKCCISKISYFGIFVQVEGVPALIHQSEVSWDATLDLTLFFKIGQVIEAKVHQLDFSLERIFLSLKEITPDPLIEDMEAVVDDHAKLDGRLETQPENKWDDVESLVKELQQYEGIESVKKGRFSLSPGLAPTFQVYMASMFQNQYKLLARAENKVQEVIVQTSLNEEEMKSAILTCTNRV